MALGVNSPAPAVKAPTNNQTLATGLSNAPQTAAPPTSPTPTPNTGTPYVTPGTQVPPSSTAAANGYTGAQFNPGYSPTPATPATGPGGITSIANPTNNPIIDQFNAWIQAQYVQGQQSAGLATGLANATNANDLTTLNNSSAAQLAALMQQQYRDVTLAGLNDANTLKFAGQTRDNQDQALGLNRDIGLRANISNAASSGAASAKGTFQNTRDIFDKYHNQFTANDISYNHTAADIAVHKDALDSLGKEYGIRADEITNQLKSATVKLGLNYAQTVQQINAQLKSGNSQLQQQAINFMMQLMALPDTNAPNYAATTNQVLGASGTGPTSPGANQYGTNATSSTPGTYAAPGAINNNGVITSTPIAGSLGNDNSNIGTHYIWQKGPDGFYHQVLVDFNGQPINAAIGTQYTQAVTGNQGTVTAPPSTPYNTVQ